MGSRVILLTLGTVGDIYPFIALSKALGENGHDVTLFTSSDYEAMVSRHGISFQPICDDLEHLLYSGLADILRQKSALHLLARPIAVKTLVHTLCHQFIARTWEAMKDADIAIYHPSLAFVPELAAAANISSVMACLQPALPTRAFPFCLFGMRQTGPLNRITYLLPDVLRTLVKRQARGFLLRCGITPRKDPPKHGDFVLNAFSKVLCPPPVDWPDNVATTGEWIVPASWAPDDTLRRFLQAGDPPIYVTLGSMPWNAKANGNLLLEAAKRWGGRILIGTASGGFGQIESSENILPIGHVPHHLLLPHLGAIVHHGGAGTTAAGLRAGLPTLVTPIVLDQFFWGRRVEALGAGPSPQRLSTMNAAGLARAFDALLATPSYRISARAIAGQMKNEDGLAASLDVIDGVLSRERQRHLLAGRPSRGACVENLMHARRPV